MEGDVGSREGFLKWQKQEHDCSLVGKSELRGKINHVGAKGTVVGRLILLGKKTCTRAWVGGRPRTGGTAGAAVGGGGKAGQMVAGQGSGGPWRVFLGSRKPRAGTADEGLEGGGVWEHGRASGLGRCTVLLRPS